MTPARTRFSLFRNAITIFGAALAITGAVLFVGLAVGGFAPKAAPPITISSYGCHSAPRWPFERT